MRTMSTCIDRLTAYLETISEDACSPAATAKREIERTGQKFGVVTPRDAVLWLCGAHWPRSRRLSPLGFDVEAARAFFLGRTDVLPEYAMGLLPPEHAAGLAANLADMMD